MIDIYKLKKGISVKYKVWSNDDSEMVSQFSSSSPTTTVRLMCRVESAISAVDVSCAITNVKTDKFVLIYHYMCSHEEWTAWMFHHK